MFKRIKANVLPIGAVVCMAAIMAIYCSNTRWSDSRDVFVAESVVNIIAGIAFAVGMQRGLVEEKRHVGGLICRAAALATIFINPYFLRVSREVPYMMQFVMCAKRMFTLWCPFLAIALVRKVGEFVNRRGKHFVWTAAIYYIVSFAAIGAMQKLKVWQVYDQYDGLWITWEALEVIYQAAVVNIVFIHYLASRPQLPRKSCAVFAAFANCAALSGVICHSWHIREILTDFAEQFQAGGLMYALRKTEWLQNRMTLFNNVVEGNYAHIHHKLVINGVGINRVLTSTLGEQAEERFGNVIYTTNRVAVSSWEEPLVYLRLNCGWEDLIATLILYALLIVILFKMKYENRTAEGIGRIIKYSFAGLCGLSLLTQAFLPADQLMMPLMGQGSAAVFMMTVYILLPRVFKENGYLRRFFENAGTKRISVDEEHLDMRM